MEKLADAAMKGLTSADIDPAGFERFRKTGKLSISARRDNGRLVLVWRRRGGEMRKYGMGGIEFDGPLAGAPVFSLYREISRFFADAWKNGQILSPVERELASLSGLLEIPEERTQIMPEARKPARKAPARRRGR